MNYLVTILKQPSTWRGITLIMTSAGVNLSPEQATQIISLGMAVAGAIGVFFSDVKTDEGGR